MVVNAPMGDVTKMCVCAPMVSCTNGGEGTNGWCRNYDVSKCTNGELHQ